MARSLRSRSGRICLPLTMEALHGTSPHATSLSNALDLLPHVAAMQTDPVVWSCSSIADAWSKMHEVIREAQDSNTPSRVEELRKNDLKALALCTAHAEILCLMNLFPGELKDAIMRNPRFSTSTVEEFYLHLGQDIEVRGDSWLVRLPPPSLEDLRHTLKEVGEIGEDGRGCIESTAHRVSVWRGKNRTVLGITVRVGRYVPNAARAIIPLAAKGNVLILSKAGMGKTTLLRDLGASMANSGLSRVTVVDTSNEVGGDSAAPMAFLGRCRRIQVPQRNMLSQVMAEVIQNHSPEVLIVDELVSAEEAQAAWSISQRGVRLVATCHGESLEGLLQNQSLKLLVGGTAQAFLSNEERRLRHKQKKTVLERPYSSPFDFVVEIVERNRAFVYTDVNRAVDLVLDDKKPKRNAAVGGYACLTDDLPEQIANQVNGTYAKPQCTEEKRRSNETYEKGGRGKSRVLFDEFADAL